MAGAATPTVPYVCRYDSWDDAPRRRGAGTASAAAEHPASIPPLPSERQPSSKSAVGGSGEEDCPVRGVASARRRLCRDAEGREARRKTWPERRRERREVKRLRRDAQARREAGVSTRPHKDSDDDDGGGGDNDASRGGPFSRTPPHRGRRSKERSREGERWRKARGVLWPHDDWLSARVRHRRR